MMSNKTNWYAVCITALSMCKLPELENVAIYHTKHVSVFFTLHALITLDKITCILNMNYSVIVSKPNACLCMIF